MKKIKHFLLVVWQFPQELLGLAIRLVLMRFSKLEQYSFHVEYLHAIPIYKWQFRSGLSLGGFRFVSSVGDENQMRHEYGHSIQSLYLGWFYLLIIGLPSIIWNVLNRYTFLEKYNYYSFYTEKWADSLGLVQR